MEIRADLPALVLAVPVQIGDTVVEGQVIVLLESMKLEIPIEAPGPGTVIAISAWPGLPVDEGDLLLELAP